MNMVLNGKNNVKLTPLVVDGLGGDDALSGMAGDDYIQGGAGDLLRSTRKNPEKITLALKSYRQETAANDFIVGLERSAA